MKRKIFAWLAGILLVLYVILGAPSLASAHTGAVNGTAVCEDDGTYTVTWTYNATNVPDGVEAETKVIKDLPEGSLLNGSAGQIHLSVWAEHSVNQPGVPTKTGNWSQSFTQSGIPGTATQAEVMVQTDWKGGPSEDPVGTVPLDGTCTPPPVIPEQPPAEIREASSERIDCEVKKVAISHSITTVPYIYDAPSNTWVLDEANAVTEDGGITFRDLTESEKKQCPDDTPTTPTQPPVTPPTTVPTSPTPSPSTPITVPTDTTGSPATEPAATEEGDTEGLAVTGPEDNLWLWPVAFFVLSVGLLSVLGSKFIRSRKVAE